MDELEALRVSDCIDKAYHLMDVMSESESKCIKDLLSKWRESIKEYNWENKDVVNATDTEIGMFRSVCKKTLKAHYRIKTCVSDQYANELSNRVNNTIFSNHLISAKILLSRRCNYYQMTPLEKVMNENIKIQIIKEFKQQNQDYKP